MISRIEGELLEVRDGRAQLQCGSLTYELLIPGADEQRLSASARQTIIFHTLHYLESPNNGASYLPRLIGFASPADRAFFELFTTVKGIGSRKALRALQIPFADVAAAIAAKDLDILKSLPEIGKRTAETIVAELNGKVEQFIEFKPGANDRAPLDDARAALIRDAVAVLTQLGEQKLTARTLVDRALAADSTIEDAQTLVAAAFRLRES